MLCLGLIGKKTQKYFIKQQTVLGKINEKIEEVYTNQNIVTVFDAKEKEGKQFDSTNNELRKNSLKAQFFSGMMMPLMGFIHYFDYFAVSLVATILIVNGVFGTVMEGAAVFATFILFTNLLQSPIAQIGQGITSIQIILASSENIAEFLALPEMPEEQKEGAKIEEFKGEVEFKNVDFSYNESKKIIDNFNINITSGQKVAIVGPTGSGKTTITNLLLRFYEISGGDILIDGVSIKDMKKDYLRSLFSLVLQDS
jgi:ATP-binding cassette subfamily B protein